jgi:hypothetical protein
MYFECKNWYDNEWFLCKVKWYQGVFILILDLLQPNKTFMKRRFVPWWRVKKY